MQPVTIGARAHAAGTEKGEDEPALVACDAGKLGSQIRLPSAFGDHLIGNGLTQSSVDRRSQDMTGQVPRIDRRRRPRIDDRALWREEFQRTERPLVLWCRRI